MAGLNTQSAKAPLKERKDDLYETPASAVHALLKAERLPHHIWEPACGPGAIVRVLRAAGHEVWATDLVDYNSPDQDLARLDFLFGPPIGPTPVSAIVTNPPFKLATEFVAEALLRAPKVIMLLRLAFLESSKRSAILDSGKLARVHVFRNRLPMMHRDGFEEQKSMTSALAFAWFVWDAHHRGPTEMHRISWLETAKQ